MDNNSGWVIYDTNDFHIVDTASTAVDAMNKAWWRSDAKATTRENYNKLVAENVTEVP